MSPGELLEQLDRLIARFERCHRLIHDDSQISDEEIVALIKARDHLVVERKPKKQRPSDPPNLFNYPGGHSPS